MKELLPRMTRMKNNHEAARKRKNRTHPGCLREQDEGFYDPGSPPEMKIKVSQTPLIVDCTFLGAVHVSLKQPTPLPDAVHSRKCTAPDMFRDPSLFSNNDNHNIIL
jgi:hypothetical protein